MANKLTRKRPNRLLTGRNNYFAFGSEMSLDNPLLMDFTTKAYHGYRGDPLQTKDFVQSANLNGANINMSNLPGSLGGQPMSNQIQGGPNILQQGWSTLTGALSGRELGALMGGPMGVAQGISSAIGAVGLLGGNLISNGLESSAGNIIGGLGNAVSSIPLVGGLAQGALGIIGGGVNALFGSKMNKENIAKTEGTISNLNSLSSDASNFDTLSDTWSSTSMGTDFANSFIGKDGLFSNKAKKKAEALRTLMQLANAFALNTLENNASNITQGQANVLESNFAAYGGPLLFANGGSIHIKPENRGKFTETKRRTGKTTEELTHSKNPLTRKRAIFALNAKKWHHAFGGDLMTHGANFDTGVTLIGNGNTHEQNPYEGVPMGVDQEGVPNLVEEGEVIFNDYVFSNRLKVPKAVRNKYKLRGNKSLTFADAALLMSKESEERPNDPISQNGLQALLGELAYVLEGIREKKQAKKTYAYGGNLFKDGGTEHTPYPGGPQALTPYDWANFMYNGVSLYDPITRLYNPMYTQEGFRQFVRDNWDTLGTAYWNDKTKVPNWDSRNKGKIPSLDDLLGVPSKSPGLMYDGPYGNPQAYSDAHNFGLYMLDQYMKLNPAKVQYKIRQGKGKDPLDFTGEFEYYDGNRDGYTWLDVIKGHYTSAGSPVYDPETNTTTYYYDPVKKALPKKFRFYDYAEKYDKDSPYREYDSLDAAQEAGEDLSRFGAPKDGEKVTTYRGLKPSEKMPEFDDWMRYAPIAGSLTGLGMSLFSKPDESGAEAILEASRGAGTYQPVKFNPVGNYLTYNPFDIEFAANQANAESAAARRAILNTSGGNRAQAMTGILAADNNALNQLGVLRRGAAEDYLKQRWMVEDFNRATNMFNSEGFFKADAANQQALAQAGDFSLRGTMAAEEIRQSARLAKDNAIQANLSGLFTSLGNIGQERVARQQMKWMVDNGFAPGYGTTKAAKGGKIKRRKKGLTY